MIDPASAPSTDLIGTRVADDLRGQGADKGLVVNEARRTKNTLVLRGFVCLASKLDAVSVRGRSPVRGMDAGATLTDFCRGRERPPACGGGKIRRIQSRTPAAGV
jgi:hypothetical protein